MNDNNLYSLLAIIKQNGDVRRLIRKGLDYKMIAELTNTAILAGYISYENETVSLSIDGETKFLELDKHLKITDKNKWIEPKNESKISSIEKDFIFLPKQDELHF